MGSFGNLVAIIFVGATILIDGEVNSMATYHDLYTESDRGLMVHLFEWKWTDIANECESFLQHYGYGAVQISPPNEHILISNPNFPWWERYQPVSYKLVSRSGNEDQFRDMVTRCNNVGVRIIVDGVLNHMVGVGQSGTGSAGSSFVGQGGSESFPAVPYGSGNFNDKKCTSSSGNIENWGDINQIRYCRLVGLLDLDQSQDYVRQKMIGYLNTLIDIGVAGFRLDATKHMWPGDVKAILDGTNNLNTAWFPAGARAFVVQEVQQDNVVSASDYFGSGRTTNFRYGVDVSNAATRNNNFKYFATFGSTWYNWDGDDVLNFIDNHDTQRNGGPINYKSGDQYTLAVTFMLAWPYGYKRVMSSYYFNSNDQSPPLDGSNNIGSPTFNSDMTCQQSSGWVCEHRWPAIRRMAKFNGYVGNAAIGNIVTDDHRIAFTRGTRGFFAVNNGYSDWSTTFQTSLPAGTYCDIVSGEIQNNACTGSMVTVDGNGNAKVTISSGKSFAIYPESNVNCQNCGPVTAQTIAPTVSSGTNPPINAQRTVIFIHKQTVVGQDLFVRGGIDHSRLTGCTTNAQTSACAIPMLHQTVVPSSFTTYKDWEQGDVHLDWYGAETGQGTHNGVTAQGTPLAWSTNDQNVIGYQSLNTFGPHYWIIDVLMDCSKAYQGKYFELKAYLAGGDGWEQNVSQGSCSGNAGFTNAPFSSQNHIGVCGKVNVYEFNSNWCIVNNF